MPAGKLDTAFFPMKTAGDHQVKDQEKIVFETEQDPLAETSDR